MATLACSMSHRTVCEELLKTNADICAVFEDDNEIPTDQQSRFRFFSLYSYFEKIPGSFNIINLSPCFSVRPGISAAYGIYTGTGMCMNAYLLSRAGARAILSKKINRTLDQYLPKLDRVFYIHPRLFKQNEAQSSLGNPNSPPEYIGSVIHNPLSEFEKVTSLRWTRWTS